MSDHIVIGDIRPRIQYTADGTQTDFIYPFPIFAAADLKVYVGEVLQASGYTVTGAGLSAGGTVAFAVPPSAGAKVTLLRALAIARNTDFQEGGAFRAKTINDELDRQTAFVQEAAERIERALVAGPTESAVPLVLPPLATRANALLGFDGTGAPIAAAGAAGGVAIAAAMLPLVQAANTAAARTALGLGTAATRDHGTGDTNLPLGTQSRLARIAESVKTADYTVAAADAGAMLVANKATAIAFALTAAASLGAGFAVMARNIGAGDLTIDPAGAETINGAATLVLKQNEAAMLWTDGANWRGNVWGASTKVSVALIRDEKTDGTAGGSSVASAWTNRDLNTKIFDFDNIVSLTSNQFTLSVGLYLIAARAPFLTNANTSGRVRIRNVSDATDLVLGPSFVIGTTTGLASNFFVECTGIALLTSSKTYSLQYYSAVARSTDGLGAHDGLSLGNEVYSEVLITKFA